MPHFSFDQLYFFHYMFVLLVSCPKYKHSWIDGLIIITTSKSNKYEYEKFANFLFLLCCNKEKVLNFFFFCGNKQKKKIFLMWNYIYIYIQKLQLFKKKMKFKNFFFYNNNKKKKETKWKRKKFFFNTQKTKKQLKKKNSHVHAIHTS